MNNLNTVLSKWFKDDLIIIPPKIEQSFNQGGCFVFSKDGELELGHCDRGTGDHVDLESVEKLVEAMM